MIDLFALVTIVRRKTDAAKLSIKSLSIKSLSFVELGNCNLQSKNGTFHVP